MKKDIMTIRLWDSVIVSKVIKYMENDCIMKEEYVSRVDSFFKYHDKDNCKRVYDWLYNH